MQRRVRHFSRKIQRTFDDVKSRATNFGRSNSDYYYPQRSITAVTTSSHSLSSTDDDLVFEGTVDEESSADDTRAESDIIIPCEFCQVQQSVASLTRHQLLCTQNPNYDEQRINLSTTVATDASRRRVVSENVTRVISTTSEIGRPKPSAPPRSRSTSPTEGFEIPSGLQCPITYALLRDPVVASDGHTYERKAIIGWLRTSQRSPITRQPISRETLNPNRAIQTMAREFRAQCIERRRAHKYLLDNDLKKKEEIIELKTENRTVYQVEWMKNTILSNSFKSVLTHLTGDNAKQIGEDNCRVGPHPNIVRTFGNVEHKESGILLLQESFSKQTLSQLIENTDEKFSNTVLDTILYQIACALQHLVTSETIHGTITTRDIFIYQLDESPENILVKLINTGEWKEPHSEKSYVYTFGVLARELYALELFTNNEDSTERQHLFDRCTATDPDLRPTLNELTKSIIDLTQNKTFRFE